MALDKKKSGFGFDMEERLKKPTATGSEGSESFGTDSMKEPKARERKDKRIQILTYESLINRMDAYAQRQGVSRAEVFEAAVTAFLDKFDA